MSVPLPQLSDLDRAVHFVKTHVLQDIKDDDYERWQKSLKMIKDEAHQNNNQIALQLYVTKIKELTEKGLAFIRRFDKDDDFVLLKKGCHVLGIVASLVDTTKQHFNEVLNTIVRSGTTLTQTGGFDDDKKWKDWKAGCLLLRIAASLGNTEAIKLYDESIAIQINEGKEYKYRYLRSRIIEDAIKGDILLGEATNSENSYRHGRNCYDCGSKLFHLGVQNSGRRVEVYAPYLSEGGHYFLKSFSLQNSLRNIYQLAIHLNDLANFLEPRLTNPIRDNWITEQGIVRSISKEDVLSLKRQAEHWLRHVLNECMTHARRHGTQKELKYLECATKYELARLRQAECLSPNVSMSLSEETEIVRLYTQASEGKLSDADFRLGEFYEKLCDKFSSLENTNKKLALKYYEEAIKAYEKCTKNQNDSKNPYISDLGKVALNQEYARNRLVTLKKFQAEKKAWANKKTITHAYSQHQYIPQNESDDSDDSEMALDLPSTMTHP